MNRGIANTLAREPEKFFAYNNGIGATACAVFLQTGPEGILLLTEATDLQIVNGAQTTASLATARRERKVPLDGVFVPMKLSVVPVDLAGEMIPRISRYANSQNPVRASDFFANHEFHRRIEEISRRLLAPSVGGFSGSNLLVLRARPRTTPKCSGRPDRGAKGPIPANSIQESR